MCSITGYAQKKNISISWENEISRSSFVSPTSALVKSSATKKFSKQMALERLKLTLTKDAIDFSEQWKDTGFANPTSLKLSNVEYDAVSPKELELVSVSRIPTTLQTSISSKRGRDQIYTIFSISPLVNLNGQIKKVRSFSLSYKYYPNTNSKSLTIPVSNSVLASGDWYKFKVEKTGVHLITKGFLDNLGINTATVDPRSIKIYGHGGKPLPLLNSKNNSLFDLPQNAIQVIGEEDGSFDASDQILFYGVSTIGYDKENDTHINPYSDQAYYYITHGGATGLRISPLNEPTAQGDAITTFNDYQFHEVDDLSPAKVGRRWFGNRFDIQDEQSYVFEFPNIVQGSDVSVNVNVASASESPTSMAVSLNGTAIDPINFGTISGSTLLSYRPSSQNAAPYIVPASGETVTVNLLYNNGGNPSSIGYLDYIRVGAERQLIAGSEQFSFRYNLAATNFGVGVYSITNASQITQVWDVTNTSKK